MKNIIQKFIKKSLAVTMLLAFIVSSNSNLIVLAQEDIWWEGADNSGLSTGDFYNTDATYVTSNCDNCSTSNNSSWWEPADNYGLSTGGFYNTDSTYITSGCDNCSTTNTGSSWWEPADNYGLSTGGFYNTDSTYITSGCDNCSTTNTGSSWWEPADNYGLSTGGFYNTDSTYITSGCNNCGTPYVPADWSGTTGSTLFVSPAVYNTTPISYNTGSSYVYTPTNWNTGSSWYNTAPVYNTTPIYNTTPVYTTPVNNNTNIIDNGVCNGNNNCNTNTVINNPTPVYPSPTPISYPCSYNGQTYYNINDFNLYCKAPVTTYHCSINGQTYYNLSDYNNYCKAPTPTTYYCSINGQTYYNLSDYNNYCKSNVNRFYCSYNGYYYNTQYEFNTLCKAPVSLYCALNGNTYYNTTDYSNGCKKYCTQNGYYYATQYDYDNYCRVPVTNFYCSINGYTYKDVYDFNNYCKVVNNQYYCNLNGRTYGNPSDYNYYCKNVSYTHKVVTTIPTNIGQTSATCNAVAMMGGNVQSNGYFEYGTSYSLGRITNSANVGNVSNTSYSNTITGLTPNTTYYCRAVMTNKDGTYRGEIMSFKTSAVKVKYVTEVITKKAVKKTLTKSDKGGNEEIICKDVKGNKDVISATKNLVSYKLEKLGNVQAGKVTEYIVKYENTSRIGLTNLKLKVSLPKDMKFVSTSFGSYDEYTNSLTITLGNLSSAEARDIRFAVMNSDTMQAGATNVINSLISYEVLDEKGEVMTGEVTSYTIVTADSTPINTNNVNASKDTKDAASNILPNTLIEWLVIIILLAILVVLGRNIYKGIVGEKKHESHAGH